MYKVLPLILSVFVLIACSRRDDAAAPAIKAGGSWTVSRAVVHAGYSETETRQGYTIRFADTPGENTLSFIFRSRPTASGSFTASLDTTAASHVALRLTHDGASFRPAAAGSVLSIQMLDGKLVLRAESVQMAPDTGGASHQPLSFTLREY